ncbi:MAG: NAD(P)H-dependent oxidoreductase subunit E [Anaerolineales bacterium]
MTLNDPPLPELDLDPLVDILNPYAYQGRTALLPALHAAQEQYGYLPRPVAAEVGRRLGVPLADVYGVIDFYALLYKEPIGRQIVRVCGDPPCAQAGGSQILEALSEHLGVQPREVSADGEWTLERAPCLGRCEHAPVVMIDDIPLSRAKAGQLQVLLTGEWEMVSSRVGGDLRSLTRNCGGDAPTTIEAYEASGGYAALKQAVGDMEPASVIEAVKASGLVGRGGAAFPTGVKWEGAASTPGEPKYVVNNADESEPGTFKDRVLLEDDPHSSLEGMIIAGYAIGAQKGYIYIRGEYRKAEEIVQNAIDEAERQGLLGENILGTGFTFEVEIRRGAGAYICGEETALFESVEGNRGFPRIKPPFPTTHGLFGKPTVINNVETLANIPLIVRDGPAAFRKNGTEQSTGTKLFCLSGDVARPGLYEVPFGVPLRHLLEDLGGGVVGGELQGILFGGAAGAFATEKYLDVKLTFEDLAEAGLPLGSGAVMVFNDAQDLREVLRGLAHFFADESCGKCYPCQLGTQRQYEILGDLANGNYHSGDVERLTDVGWTMVDASLCGLGQTAANAVLSAIDIWPALFSENGTLKSV